MPPFKTNGEVQFVSVIRDAVHKTEAPRKASSADNASGLVDFTKGLQLGPIVGRRCGSMDFLVPELTLLYKIVLR